MLEPKSKHRHLAAVAPPYEKIGIGSVIIDASPQRALPVPAEHQALRKLALVLEAPKPKIRPHSSFDGELLKLSYCVVRVRKLGNRIWLWWRSNRLPRRLGLPILRSPMSDAIDKTALMVAIQAALKVQIDTMRRAAEETGRAATHEEARAENDKDTRGLEQSYLARGQAMRVEALEEEAKQLRFLDLRSFDGDTPITLGAVVRLLIDDAETTYFMVPAAGGTKVIVDGLEIVLVTPAAPLGRSLLDRCVGEDFVLRLKKREREIEVLDVS